MTNHNTPPIRVVLGFVPYPDPTTGERLYRNATEEEKAASARYYAELEPAEIQAMARVVITAESTDEAWTAASKVFVSTVRYPSPIDHEPFSPMACCGRERDKDGGPNPHCECPAPLKPARCPSVSGQGQNLRCALDAGHEGEHSAIGEHTPGVDGYTERYPTSSPERGKCPSCLELEKCAATNLKCTCVPPLDIDGWTPGERDAYYSKLPGDDRLVASLDPLPEQERERCPDCDALFATTVKERYQAGYFCCRTGTLACVKRVNSRLRSDLATLQAKLDAAVAASQLTKAEREMVAASLAFDNWFSGAPKRLVWAIEALQAERAKAGR